MKKNPIACVFPGQGSQRKGMGGDLFDRYPDLCAAADAVLGYSLRELCLENPGNVLRHTQHTQPALFVVNALEWLQRQEREPAPAFLAGHSLGEYSALFAAGCFDFETGLRLVQKRGALMSQVEEGGMAAVLGLETTRVEEVLRREGGAVDIANFNLPTQLVLSGPKAALEALIEPMEKAGARKCILLNVSGAFHSRSMEPVAAEFETFLRRFNVSPPRIPVIANTTALPYPADPEATESRASHLVDQIRSSVRWSATMEYLRGQGVTEIQELGPGAVLTKLWKAAPHEAPSKSVLGSASFRQAYDLRSAYVAGSPIPGTRSRGFVTACRTAGLLSFLDPPNPETLSADLEALGRQTGAAFGVSVRAEDEQNTVDQALRAGVPTLEAVSYDHITAALVRFRFAGAAAPRLLLARVTSLRAAKRFLQPAPGDLIAALVGAGDLTTDEGQAARRLPVASDLCVSPNGLDSEDLATLLPAIQRLAKDATDHLDGPTVRVGAAGPLGTPEALASAFLLGADFVQTAAVNLCCSEAALPQEIQRRLAALAPGDTTSVPATHGFSLGARASVVKKGSLFAPRAQKLYEIFRFHDSMDDLPTALLQKLETTFFKRPLAEVWESLRQRLPDDDAHPDPKQKMALVFADYLHQTLRWTLDGHADEAAQAHIPCDASLPAFNQRTANTPLAGSEARHLSAVADWLMAEAEAFLRQRFSFFEGSAAGEAEQECKPNPSRTAP